MGQFLSLVVTGNTNLQGAVVLGSTLNVSGLVTLTGGLSVTGSCALPAGTTLGNVALGSAATHAAADFQASDSTLAALSGKTISGSGNIVLASAVDSAGTAAAAATSAVAFAIQRSNHTGTQAWSTIVSTPTTLSGYGITDPVVLTSGSYSNPGWITALAVSKLTGNLQLTNFNGGTGASGTTFWCGDGTWKTPSGGGGGSVSKYTAFLASYGNDGTGAVGDPSKPYVTAAAAVTAVKAVAGWSTLYESGPGPLWLTILPGDPAHDFGAVLFDSDATFFIAGSFASDVASQLNFIDNVGGLQITIDGNGKENVSVAVSGKGSTGAVGPNVFASNVTISVNLTGGFGTQGESGNGTNGSNGGNLTAESCNITELVSMGGNGGDGESSSGSTAILTGDPGSWGSNPTTITFSGPGGSDTYGWNGSWSLQFGSGISTIAGNSIEALAAGSGYSFTSDGADPGFDASLILTDGAAPASTSGGNGATGGQVTLKRCHVSCTSSVGPGSAGSGMNGGSNGSAGSTSTPITAYFCEIDTTDALLTTDVQTPNTPQCITNGTAV